MENKIFTVTNNKYFYECLLKIKLYKNRVHIRTQRKIIRMFI